MKMNDLLIISTSYPITDRKAIATWAHNQAKAFKKLGYTVDVVSPIPWIPNIAVTPSELTRWSKIPDKRTMDGVDVHYPRVPVYYTSWLKDNVYREYPRIDCSLTWHFTKKVFHKLCKEKDYQLTLCHNPVPTGYLGSKISQEYGIKHCVYLHSLEKVDSIAKNKSKINKYKELTGDAEYITVSERMRKEITSKLNIDPTVVYNGFDNSEVSKYRQEFEDSSNSSKNNSVFKILSVGSLTLRKGHIYLIKALETLNHQSNIVGEVSCTIVGDGEQKNSLEKYVSKSNLNDIIEFRSDLTREELNKLYDYSDLFILPSWNEPFGVVYVEAMAHGTPVIMCENEGFSELLNEYESVITVKSQSVADLRDKIEYSLENRGDIKQIGRKGEEIVNKELTWESNSLKIIDVFSDGE